MIVSLSHVLVLAWLGHPDPGLLLANYIGFWLLGVSLIPVAMFASIMTSNATIAFIFGALLCAVPIGIGQAAATVSEALGRRRKRPRGSRPLSPCESCGPRKGHHFGASVRSQGLRDELQLSA